MRLAEQRRAERYAVALTCTLEGVEGSFRVLNMSESGALMEAPTLPAELYLCSETCLLVDGVRLRCRLVRLDHRRLGVSFLDPEHSARLLAAQGCSTSLR